MTMKKLTGILKNMLGLKSGPPVPFDLLFRRFKEVLDNDNRSLEIITDMGEKLGGDYLFDIAYIRSAYSELSSAVRDSLLSFDLLTRAKYPYLREAADRIDSRIRRTIYDLPTPSEPVVFYHNISWDISHDVGGKNANLAEVKNSMGLNVPDAFVITTRAYDAFLRHNGLNGKIESLKGAEITDSALRQVRDAILEGQIPPEVDRALKKALEEMKRGGGGDRFVAVRSSAEEEDADFSFAGQFETRLNVPPESEDVGRAYREVVASLFSSRAVAYQRQVGYPPGKIKMAVGCMAMVDAEASGVIYSSRQGGDGNTLMINAAWGLGVTTVEGHSDADLYLLKKGPEPEIIHVTAGRKELMTAPREEGGITTLKTADAMRTKQSLTQQQAQELARQAMLIERHFRKPQDIEWAVDRRGEVFILQTRPLRAEGAIGPSSPRPMAGSPGEISGTEEPVLLKGRGVVVQRGIAAGRVFIVRDPEQLDRFPRGAVLVAAHDSSEYVRVMPDVSAIITDVGTPTSHMASLCREFRVPTVVNTGDATRVLVHGQEITLDADDEGNGIVYAGIRSDLIRPAARSAKMEDLYEFRKKRYIMRHISPLNLVDPLKDNFTPEGCKTMHDVIRFIHEKSVAELVESSQDAGRQNRVAVKLDIPVPAGITVVDMGGGLSAPENPGKVTFEQITSTPFRAIIRGMTHPGVWKSDAVSLRMNDFLTSMIRMSDIVADGTAHTGSNLAVVTREYVNLTLKFGYHFTVLDCYCSETARNNHIYFRFAGGATDMVKRSRRISFIAAVLREYGFNLRTKGDFLIARLSNLKRDEMEVILDDLGRLMAFTRQLDAMMHDDGAVDRYARDFLEEKYGR
jgi:pyruvate,water dikinase